MSTATNTTALRNANGETAAREALIIGSALVAMLVFLAVLRYGCNMFIDVAILRSRSISDILRSLCPWWHVRTQPTADVESVAQRHPQSSASTNDTPRQRISLESKILTQEDIQEHKAMQGSITEELEESSTSHSLTCSICLHDLHQGEDVFVSDCFHIFHKDCLIQWVEARNREDCPNCRQSLHGSSGAVSEEP